MFWGQLGVRREGEVVSIFTLELSTNSPYCKEVQNPCKATIYNMVPQAYIKYF